MDYLKSPRPFWKKETGPAGAAWVDAREADEAALERWGRDCYDGLKDVHASTHETQPSLVIFMRDLPVDPCGLGRLEGRLCGGPRRSPPS